jgi:hypothetical protein
VTVQLGINGFGRTGRSFLRAALAPPHDFEIVAINDLGSPTALARLFARDSVHGRYAEAVDVDGLAALRASRAAGATRKQLRAAALRQLLRVRSGGMISSANCSRSAGGSAVTKKSSPSSTSSPMRSTT